VRHSQVALACDPYAQMGWKLFGLLARTARYCSNVTFAKMFSPSLPAILPFDPCLLTLDLRGRRALWFVWAVFMVALGVYALGMKHTKLWVAILIKTLGAIALGWGLWELFSTVATLSPRCSCLTPK